MANNEWTDNEIELIKLVCYTSTDLAQLLPRHTKASIQAKRRKLGIVTPSGTRPVITESRIKEHCDQHGFIFIKSFTRNGRRYLEFICDCGRLTIMSYTDLLRDRKCKTCGYKKSSESQKKITLADVKAIFAKEECVLLADTFEGIQTPMPYICECGKRAKINLAHFRDGERCKECGIRKRAEKKRLKFEYVKNTFSEKGVVLLSTEYISSKSPLQCICVCGRPWTTCWNSFQQGARCGCIRSRGERLIEGFLKNSNQSYGSQEWFSDCKIKRPLRFDFTVKAGIREGALIEYHGQQHYWPAKWEGMTKEKARKEYLLITKRDATKEIWCHSNERLLLIIPYWDCKRIPEILDDFFAGREPTFSEPPKIVKKYAPMRAKIRKKLGITEPELLCGLIKEDKP